MARYVVKIQDEVIYSHVEANSPEEAEEIALEWWNGRIPEVKTQLSEPVYYLVDGDTIYDEDELIREMMIGNDIHSEEECRKKLHLAPERWGYKRVSFHK